MSPKVDWTRKAEPEELPEWMDEPCSYEEFRACLRDLGQVNRWTFATRPTLHFLQHLTTLAKSNESLKIVDVGFGGGDMLRAIEQWALRVGIAVKLVGIDLNPFAERAAREFSPKDCKIEWLTGNAFSYPEPVDVVISSLFTHHLGEDEIVRFLAWSEAVARKGWFVSDLCREPMPYRLFGPWARVMRWHRFVQHDGPVSFRRSFQETDWQRYTASAGIHPDAITLKRWMPAKLCVERIK